GGFFAASYGWAILLGGLLGSIMWANVWFVIWPNQKIVIQNAIDTAAGRPANPATGPAGARSGLASRTNTLLSIPMLFFMGAASHLTGLRVPRSGLAFWIVALAIMAVVEVNALKGTPGQGGAKPLATVKGTLWAGFILAAIFYIWFEVMGTR
ncbi:MAG TPA: urate hydroxylase PuuD, partial [Methylomirabilota bacterium]|nr:urate hydroxylase PuuD [Methylomirabilota bacterium]